VVYLSARQLRETLGHSVEAFEHVWQLDVVPDDERCLGPSTECYVEQVEAAVARRYRTFRLSTEFLDSIRRGLSDAVTDTQHSTVLRRDQLTKELASLDVQEENLLDLAAEGMTAKNKITIRLNDIEQKRQRIREQLGEVEADLTVGVELLEAALQLLSDPGRLYRQVSDLDRRLLNQAIFEKLYVENDTIKGDVIREPSPRSFWPTM
jgi:site-specific DNA recombinase